MNETPPQSEGGGPGIPPVCPGPRGPHGRAAASTARWLWWAGGALLLITFAVIFAFNPEQHAFYPRCVFHVLTGWDCPGCGGLRALHHLLRGDVVTAFHFNPLVVLGLPLAGLLAGFHAWAKRRGWTPGTRGVEALLWLLLAALLAFALVRNLGRA